MPIPIVCPHCRAADQVPDALAGQASFCAKCGKGIQVPQTALSLLASIRSACWLIVFILLALLFMMVLAGIAAIKQAAGVAP